MLCFSVILHTIAYRMQRNRTRHLLASANIHTYGIHVFKLLAHSLSALTVQRTITGMICVADTALEMNTIKSNSGECMLVSSPALSLLLLLFQAYVRLFYASIYVLAVVYVHVQMCVCVFVCMFCV